MLLVAARGAFVGGLLSTFGATAFRVWGAPVALGRMPAEAADALDRQLGRVVLWSALAAEAAGAWWLAAESGAMAEATSWAGLWAAVPAVLTSTVFGRLLGWQMLILLGVLPVRRLGRAGGPWLTLGLAAAALALQAGHGHSAAMGGGTGWLVVNEVLHLWAGGGWVGGLLPLLIVVRDAPAKAGGAGCRAFSGYGRLCVAGVAGSAAVQAWVLVGSVSGAVGTAYGWMVGVKLGLFGVLLGFALVNRYWLAPRLAGPAAASRRVLVRSIAVQTGFGLAVVGAAAVLSSLPPAMHEPPAGTRSGP